MLSPLSSSASLLAIDSAGDCCSVALIHNGQLFQQFSDFPREHTQRLLPMVDKVMEEGGASLSQLQGIAYTSGPGSFTGLRIGLSIAQGLAYGADLPLLPVSTLFSMALTASTQYELTPGQIIIPVIDARLDEVYWAAYRVEENNQLKSIEVDQIDTPAALTKKLTAQFNSSFCAIGSGWKYEELFRLSTETQVEFAIHAKDLATYCTHHFGRIEKTHPMDAKPVYLRNEINWKKRERIREEKR